LHPKIVNKFSTLPSPLGSTRRGKSHRPIVYEEAVCGLCVFGRFDQRLFDEAVSLLLSHPGLINKNKIAGLLQKTDPDSTAVFSVIAYLISSVCNDARLLSVQKTNAPPLSGAKTKPFFLSFEGKAVYPGKTIDPVFARLGWKRNVFQRSDAVPQLSKIASINPWIRGKLIFGNSVRADIVIHLLIGNATWPASTI
jgi:hypothetical protein